MAEGDAVEEPQRFVMLRIRRLLDCELSGAQVHVKITLTSHCAGGKEETSTLKTPSFPVVNGTCWLESWLRIPSEATVARLEVIQTATSWYGTHFRIVPQELGHAEFYLPFPSDEWTLQRLDLRKFSLLNAAEKQFNAMMDPMDEEDPSTPGLLYSGPVAEAMEDGLGATRSVADAQSVQQSSRSTPNVPRLSMIRNLSVKYQKIVEEWTTSTGATLLVDARVTVEEVSSASATAENEIEALTRPLHSYAHGGFMGSAISLMQEEPWTRRLSRFEPGNSARCDALSAQPGATEKQKLKLMAFLENSPVLCAYGLYRSGCLSGGGGPTAMVPNRFGYAPLALEWDLWVDPATPQVLSRATIDHGSAIDLVKQALLTGAGCVSMAGRVGQRHISRQGLSPPVWLRLLGEAVNEAVSGDAKVPLPVAEGQLQAPHSARLQLWVVGAKGAPEGSELRVTAAVAGNEWGLPKVCAHRAAAQPWPEPLDLWPLALESLPKAQVHVRVEARPAGGGRWQLLGEAEVGLEASLGRLDGATQRDWSGLLGLGAGGAQLDVRMQMAGVPAIEAWRSKLDVPDHAAVTCMALLSHPGGLYLDVKSAYSTAADIATFVGSLTALGITTQAVCSFVPAQLPDGLPNVLFFHGLSGLENACDDGKLARGQRVLFNGASFLIDIYENPETLAHYASAPSKAQGDPNPLPLLVDPVTWTRYQALVNLYGVVGGIYIQEPDCSTACCDALTQLVNKHPEMFPLGFAYGHVPSVSLGYVSQTGRGFAAQQLLEELAAREALSNKVARRIQGLEHRDQPLVVTKAWADRLLNGRALLRPREQRLLLQLLADVSPVEALPDVVAHMGGVAVMVSRFLQHYEAVTPFSQLELGYNSSCGVPMLRLLRDHGVLAALPPAEKVQLAAHLVSNAAFGKGAQFWLQRMAVRASLHKLAREGLACLWESANMREAAAMEEALGGPDTLALMLRGHLHLSRSYHRRVLTVREMHQKHPLALLYSTPGFPYSALPGRETSPMEMKAVLHTRDVPPGQAFWKSCVPLTNTVAMLVAGLWMCLCSCGLSSLMLVRVCLPWCDTRKFSAVTLMLLLCAIGFTVFVLMLGTLGLAVWFDPEFGAVIIAQNVLESYMGVTTISLAP